MAPGGSTCAAGLDTHRQNDLLSIDQERSNPQTNEDWSRLGLAAKRSTSRYRWIGVGTQLDAQTPLGYQKIGSVVPTEFGTRLTAVLIRLSPV